MNVSTCSVHSFSQVCQGHEYLGDVSCILRWMKIEIFLMSMVHLKNKST